MEKTYKLRLDQWGYYSNPEDSERPAICAEVLRELFPVIKSKRKIWITFSSEPKRGWPEILWRPGSFRVLARLRYRGKTSAPHYIMLGFREVLEPFANNGIIWMKLEYMG